MMNFSIRQGTIVACAVFLTFVQAHAQELRPAPSPAEKGEMRSLYHEADMARLEAKRDHNVSIDMRRAFAACISRAANIDECRAETDYVLTLIADRVSQAHRSETERLAAEALRHRGGDQHQTNIITQQKQSITIINRPHFVERYPTPTLGPYPPRPRYTPRPNFTPLNRFQAGDGF